MKKIILKNHIKKIPGILLICFYFIFGVIHPKSFKDLTSSTNPILFSHQTQDNLKEIILDAITSAKSSIFLRMFHINDKDIETALIKKAKENISVKIICHSLSKNSLLSQEPGLNIECRTKKGSRKLMHTKTLIIDGKFILLGSANITKQSLFLDKNLMMGVYNEYLCKNVINNTPCDIMQNNQQIIFKTNPKENKENRELIKSLILNARHSIKIAMYVFSLKEFLDALLIAYNNGVSIEIIINNSHASLTQKLIEKEKMKLPIFVKTFPHLLHHKFAWIDDEIIIIGSANWTHNGFYNNDEHILYIYNLTKRQKETMQHIWQELSSCKRPLLQPDKKQNIDLSKIIQIFYKRAA